ATSASWLAQPARTAPMRVSVSSLLPRPPSSTLFPYTTLFRSVHPANTMRLADALIKANKRFDLLILPGKRHGFGDYQPYFTRRRSEEHTSELQSLTNLVCRLLLEKKKRQERTPPQPKRTDQATPKQQT